MVTTPSEPSSPGGPASDGQLVRLPTLSPPALELLASVAELLLTEMNQFTENQFRMISEYRPSMYRNKPFRVTIRNICEDNIQALSRILSNYPEFNGSFIPKADSFARGAATSHDGITLTELLDLYRRGQALFFQDLLNRILELYPSGSALNEVVNYVTVRWNAYIDQALTHTVAGFVADRERLRVSAQRRRRRVVDALLGGEEIDAVKVSRQLGYELHGTHLGLVLRQPPDAADDELEQLAGRFGELGSRALGARGHLVVPRDRHEVWAWFGVTEAKPTPSPSVLRGLADQLGLQVSVGRPGSGSAGFVRSNREARWAARTVQHVSAPAAVTSYEAVAALSLIELDKEHIWAFVRGELGDLAVRDRRAQLLRETVAVFLREGRNARRAAELLDTHKNTVIYRIGKAEELMRRPVLSECFELELALRMVELYGDWTLSD